MTVDDVRHAVTEFLRKEPDHRRINVTRVAPLGVGGAAWETAAEVWVPNPTVRALGLPVEREPLDRRVFILRLDEKLNVIAYDLAEAVAEE